MRSCLRSWEEQIETFCLPENAKNAGNAPGRDVLLFVRGYARDPRLADDLHFSTTPFPVTSNVALKFPPIHLRIVV
jgi:hypothetical protein